tara:strand:- start:263 stop:499 length:237 start_codon:yes stop_codon:yes gene_type:complete
MIRKDYELIQKIVINLASDENHSWVNHSDANVRVQVVSLISRLMYNLSYAFKEDNERFSEIIFEGKIQDAIKELINNL